ncbi:MAG: hydrogenase maturation protease [Dechloromonas sp.]|nr:hydrogenase maturation protease [Dechloromonas sp.]
MTAPVVVIAVGNPSRGDDALGPLLLERLETWLQASGQAGEIELIEDFQLNIEHALDLEGRRLALFIDAGTGTPAPYTFTRLQAAPDIGSSTHALEPGAVLRVFARTCQGPAPECFVLCVRGERFELGEGLREAAAGYADEAWRLLQTLMSKPESATWIEACELLGG